MENQWPHCSRWNIKRLAFPPFGCSSVKQTLICHLSSSPAQSDTIESDGWRPQKTTTVQGATAQTAGCQQHFAAQSFTQTARKTKNFRGAWSNTCFFFLLRWVEPLCFSVTRCDFMCPCNKGLPTHGHFHVGRAINSPLTGRNNAPSLKRQCLFTVNSRSDAMATAEYTKPWAEVTHTCDLDLCRSSLTHTSFQELEIPPRGQSANYTWHQRQGAWTPVGKIQINVPYSTILGSNSLNYACR